MALPLEGCTCICYGKGASPPEIAMGRVVVLVGQCLLLPGDVLLIVVFLHVLPDVLHRTVYISVSRNVQGASIDSCSAHYPVRASARPCLLCVTPDHVSS